MIKRLLFAWVVLSLLVPMKVIALSWNTEQTEQIKPPVILDCDSDPKGDC